MFHTLLIFAFPDYHPETHEPSISFSFYYLSFHELGKKQSAVGEP